MKPASNMKLVQQEILITDLDKDYRRFNRIERPKIERSSNRNLKEKKTKQTERGREGTAMAYPSEVGQTKAPSPSLTPPFNL